MLEYMSSGSAGKPDLQPGITGSRRLFGRRKGRPLRQRKVALMQDLLPQVQIMLPERNPLDTVKLFPAKPAEIWLEIGFGGGEHLAAWAAQHPDFGFLGCEPFVNGVASLLNHIDRQQLKNIRILADDARLLLDALKQASIDRAFVLFADPWPKVRHAKRRFIGPENIPRLARVLKPGAELRLATDDPKLAVWMAECMDAAADFTPVSRDTAPPSDWIATRYEQKAIKAGRRPVYTSYRRR